MTLIALALNFTEEIMLSQQTLAERIRRHSKISTPAWCKLNLVHNEEDKKLLQLAEHYQVNPWLTRKTLVILLLASKETRWAEIANTLGTSRTPFHCFQRFQQKLNSKMKKGKWTPEEDTVLLDAFQVCVEYH